MLITSDNYETKLDYQEALEDEAERCKSHALTLVESLDYSCYNVPVFDIIDKWLKFTEGSVKKARKLIKAELQSREANRLRQAQKQKLKLEKEDQSNDD